jgi:hypothetical protein
MMTPSTLSSRPERDAESPVEDAESAPDDAAEQRIYELAKAVVRALTPGNGRSSPCEEDELRERLDQDGVLYNSAERCRYWRATARQVTTPEYYRACAMYCIGRSRTTWVAHLASSRIHRGWS